MKNKLLIFLSFIFLIFTSIFSCKETTTSETTRYIYLKRVDNITSLVEITSKNQLNNITRYDDALIIVSQEGCEHCQHAFKDMREVIKVEHILVYFVDINIYQEAYNDVENQTGEYSFFYPKISGTPTYLFYRQGKLIAYKSGAYDEGTTSTEIRKYVIYSNMYSINTFHLDEGKTNYYIDYEEEHDYPGISTTALDNKIESKTDFSVMYSWRKCGDCKEYYDYVLYPFLNKNKDKKIYIYEVDGYYTMKNYVDENNKPNDEFLSLWYDFANKYHLIDYEFYDKYNHRSGVVPTIISYKDNSYKIDVFRNDYGIIFNDDNTLSYSHSFNQEVLKIKSFTKVNNQDENSSEYVKAKKELFDKALDVEIKSSTTFLENNL